MDNLFELAETNNQARIKGKARTRSTRSMLIPPAMLAAHADYMFQLAELGDYEVDGEVVEVYFENFIPTTKKMYALNRELWIQYLTDKRGLKLKLKPEGGSNG